MYVVVAAPVFVTDPSAALPPTTPLTSQFTGVPEGTHRAAAKSCDWPSVRVAEVGAIEFTLVQPIPTLAVADFEGSATLVAVTLTVGGEGNAPGAVNIAASTPVAAIVPFVASPPFISFTLHFTSGAGFPELVTVAVNGCVAPGKTPAANGEICTSMSLVIVTPAESLALASAALVAVTVTLVVAGSIEGALYCPLELIVPVCALPPATPLTVQVTPVFVAPVTFA